MSDLECYEEIKRWSSHPHLSSMYLRDSKPIYRTSSYLEQQQPLQHCSSEHILVPKSSFTSFPQPGSPQSSHNNSLHLNMSSLSAGHPLPYSPSSSSPLSNFALLLSGVPREYQYNTNMSRLNSPNISRHNHFKNQWTSCAGVLHGDQSILLNNILQHQYQNGLLPPQLMFPQHQRGHISF